MDQTTGTEAADLTETEKYLVSSSTMTTMDSPDHSSDIDDDDDEEPAHDALLGGIRTGLRTMTKTARTSLSTCKNEKELEDAIDRIQSSSLTLLKLEKSFLKTASIVSEVVADLVSDFEDEDDDDQQSPPSHVSGGKKGGGGSGDGDMKGAGDADEIGCSKQKPYIFRPSQRNVVPLERFKDKLTKEYHKRMEEYKDSLSDDYLKEDKKFEALLKEIKLGKDDAKTSIKQLVEDEQQKKKNLADKGQPEKDDFLDNESTDNDSFLCSLPYTKEDLKHYRYRPYNEDDDMDPSVLPSVDPISKVPIAYPVKNKYCNHVFDRASIYAYIAGNDDAKCPVHSCRNKRKLERAHFIADSVLTAHIRRKNNF